MIRLHAIHAATLAAMFAAGGWLANDWTEAHPATTDPYHGPCTPEAALDDPATWGKGGTVPPTCLTDAPRDPFVFERAKGAPLTPSEWDVVNYRWFRTHEPDRPLFVALDAPRRTAQPTPHRRAGYMPPPVPLPGAVWLLVAGLAGLWMIRNRRTT